MKKLLILAGVCMAVSLFNMLNLFLTKNGISLILGVFWLAGSGYMFVQYRKMKAKSEQADQAPEQEAIEE